MTNFNALFIDDNPTNNYLTQLNIKFDKLPITAHIFEQALVALDYLENCANPRLNSTDIFPDFIFIDINMPVMDGFEFIRAYEDSYFHAHPNTEIYLMTSFIHAETQQKATRCKSVHGLFNKPFTSEILKQVINHLTSRKSLAA